MSIQLNREQNSVELERGEAGARRTGRKVKIAVNKLKGQPQTVTNFKRSTEFFSSFDG